MNQILSIRKKGSLENPQGEMPLIIKRYIYEALRSIEFANQNNVSELHIIVGCTHERPLEYLLSNRKILNSLKPYI